MRDAGLPECALPKRQEDGCLSLDDMTALLNDASCTFSLPDGGLCFSIAQTVVDKHGHQLDGDRDPLGHHGCDHRDTAEWRAEHPRHHHRRRHRTSEKAMSDTTTDTAEAPVLLAVSTTPALPDVAPVETTATVGVDQAVSQVKALLPAGADASPVLLIGGAATLAVVGGAIKFGPQMLKARAEKQAQEHEAKMKQLEIEQQKAEQQKQQDDNHQQCSAARVALEVRVAAAEQRASGAEAKVSSLESKISELSSKSGGLDLGGFDPEALEERLQKLEKSLKAKPAVVGKKR